MIMAIVIAIVSGVVGYTIVDNIIGTTAWNSALGGTIASYIVPLGLLGLIGLAAFGGAIRND